jgi:hypothetical protein
VASITGAQQFQDLAQRLKEAGETGLRRELNKAIRDAAEPVAAQIRGVVHLRDYMPDRYADVLATDLQVSVHARAGGTAPGITLFARAPTIGRGGRKIRQREAGTITHPLFGNKERWFTQTAGMKPGFFSDPAERSAPQVRDKIQEAMSLVADEITGRF